MPLNLANAETFDRIANLMGECTGGAASAPGKPSGLFPDDFIHLGGDEAACAPSIRPEPPPYASALNP